MSYLLAKEKIGKHNCSLLSTEQIQEIYHYLRSGVTNLTSTQKKQFILNATSHYSVQETGSLEPGEQDLVKLNFIELRKKE